MLSSENGLVKIKGNQVEILSDLTTLINTLQKKEVLDRQDVDEAVKLAFMTSEELEAEMCKSAALAMLASIFDDAVKEGKE